MWREIDQTDDWSVHVIKRRCDVLNIGVADLIRRDGRQFVVYTCSAGVYGWWLSDEGKLYRWDERK